MSRKRVSPRARTRDLPTSGNLVVNNTQACAIFLPPCMVDGKRFASQCLHPGQNDVDAAHFDAAIKTPGMRQYVALGYIEPIGEGKAEPIPSGLDGLADSDVKDRLAAMTDAAALVELRDLTTSTTFRRMADDRIRELTAPAGDGEDGSTKDD